MSVLIILFAAYLAILGGIFHYRNRPDVSRQFPFIHFQAEVSEEEPKTVSLEAAPLAEKFTQPIYLPPPPPPVVTTVTPLPPPVVNFVTTTTWEPVVTTIDTPEEIIEPAPCVSAFLP